MRRTLVLIIRIWQIDGFLWVLWFSQGILVFSEKIEDHTIIEILLEVGLAPIIHNAIHFVHSKTCITDNMSRERETWGGLMVDILIVTSERGGGGWYTRLEHFGFSARVPNESMLTNDCTMSCAANYFRHKRSISLSKQEVPALFFGWNYIRLVLSNQQTPLPEWFNLVKALFRMVVSTASKLGKWQN